MMSTYPQAPIPAHLYSEELQLKLYQAFIFSIPILFSIILFLLFYLFYLKRRTNSALASRPSTLPRTSIPGTPISNSNKIGLKGIQIDKLPMILFDEDLSTRESQCCVCLGEFEMKEELNQIPSCKHMFHIDCIRHWLHSNSTCPLCRCSVLAAAASKVVGSQEIGNLIQNAQIVSLEQQEQVVVVAVADSATNSIASCSREECVVL